MFFHYMPQIIPENEFSNTISSKKSKITSHKRKLDSIRENQQKQQAIKIELQRLHMVELSDIVYKIIIYIHNSYV